MAQRGRPTEYKPEYCDFAVSHMRDGASIAELAYLLKISRNCLNEWRHKHPEFEDAVKKGIDDSEGWWMLEGRKNIGNKDFNSTLWYMNMKNRFHWSDRTVQDTNITFTQEEWLKGMKD